MKNLITQKRPTENLNNRKDQGEDRTWGWQDKVELVECPYNKKDKLIGNWTFEIYGTLEKTRSIMGIEEGEEFYAEDKIFWTKI